MHQCTDVLDGIVAFREAFANVPYSDDQCPLPCKYDKYSLNLEYQVSTEDDDRCSGVLSSDSSLLVVSFSTATDIYKQASSHF